MITGTTGGNECDDEGDDECDDECDDKCDDECAGGSDGVAVEVLNPSGVDIELVVLPRVCEELVASGPPMVVGALEPVAGTEGASDEVSPEDVGAVGSPTFLSGGDPQAMMRSVITVAHPVRPARRKCGLAIACLPHGLQDTRWLLTRRNPHSRVVPQTDTTIPKIRWWHKSHPRSPPNDVGKHRFPDLIGICRTPSVSRTALLR